MIALGAGIYMACVDFILGAAALFRVSYRDVNAFLFFILWPAVTLALAVIIVAQRRLLSRANARNSSG